MLANLRAQNIQAFSKYKSADGSVGATVSTGGLFFKNGLFVGGTVSAVSTSIAPDSVTIMGTAGLGYIAFTAQSSAPALAPAHIYADASGRIVLGHSGPNTAGIVFNNTNLTATRTLVVQDKDGTIATTGDNVSQFINDAGYVPQTRTISAGNGLTGGGDLSANRTITLGTPSANSVSSTNAVTTTSHTHQITSSANPGAAAAILASDVSGYLRLVRLGIGTAPTQPLEVAGNAFINAATANLYMKDTSTGLQVSTSGIVTLQSGNAMRNGPGFTSGLSGWNESYGGDVEFNNGRFRGEFAASVFKISELSATAGTFGVFYSASTIATSDCLTAAVVGNGMSLTAKNSDAGAMLFAVNDVLRIKSWTGSGISDAWMTVTSRTNNGTTTTYSGNLSSGSTNATFKVGTAVIDYGPSGTGFITLSTDSTVGISPNLTMATHAGSPWSAFTTLLRLGNLNESYDYATDVYGLGIGQYGTVSKSWLTIDQTNGFRIGNNTTVLGQWDVSGNAAFGQVATSKANMYWNASNQRLEFRGGTSGTVVQSYVDTDGSFNAGGGNVALSSAGLVFVTPTSALTGTNSVSWIDSSNSKRTGIISNYRTGGIVHGYLEAKSEVSGDAAVLNLLAANDLGVATGITITETPRSGSNKGYLNIGNVNGWVTIGDATAVPVHVLDVYGDAWFQSAGSVMGIFTTSSSSVNTQLQIDALAAKNANLVYTRAGVPKWYVANLGASDNYSLANSDANGNLERLAITQAGAITISGYGAGTLTTDASGNITATSDEKLKIIKGDFSRGLDALRSLRPIRYRWTKDSGLDRSQEYVGFGARHTKRHIPEAVGKGPNGFHTMSDRVILAVAVNAIKELEEKYESLSNRIAA